MARSARTRAVLVAAIGAVALNLASLAFCGAPAAAPARGSLAGREGWRLDLIEIGPKGIGQLVVHEGYYIGEKAMFQILAQNGFRYRMRATREEMKKGIDCPPISQLGPLKLRLYESFGGSCRKPGLVRPEGYRGHAGTAAWDTDLPINGGFVTALKGTSYLEQRGSSSSK